MKNTSTERLKARFELNKLFRCHQNFKPYNNIYGQITHIEDFRRLMDIYKLIEVGEFKKANNLYNKTDTFVREHVFVWVHDLLKEYDK